MWHPDENGAYGFEVLRPDGNGDSEILKVSLSIHPDKVVIQGAENTFTIFEEDLGDVLMADFQSEYLIINLEGLRSMEFKIESEGLVCDYYQIFEPNGDSEHIDTAAIWWEDL